jgi:hypothetical protein
VAAVAVAALLGWLAFGGGDGDGGPVAEPSPSPSAAPSIPAAPPPPAESQFSDGTWTLERYVINRLPDGFSLDTTIVNRGSEPAAGTAVIHLYKGGVFTGTATGAVPQTPAGGSSNVTLTSSEPWQPGAPEVIFLMLP